MKSAVLNLPYGLSSISDLYPLSLGIQEVSEFLNCCYIFMNVSWEKYAYFVGDKCKEDWHNELELLDCELSIRDFFLLHN